MAEDLTFGEWLKRRRKQLDLTQQELADQIGCSVNTVRKIEQNSRRPSKQLAELMVPVLEIPAEKVEPFITLARTEVYSADMFDALSQLNEIQTVLPAMTTADSESQILPFSRLDFLKETEAQSTEPPIFVGRQNELAQLTQKLAEALDGRASIVFVSGEAGQGKTSLLEAFATQAQETYPDLVVARGVCDVYTGMGDAFLPFRDVLGMLTGDIETQWRAGKIGRDHALRLWGAFPDAVATLLTYGRGLINTLLSAHPLLKRVETYWRSDSLELHQLRQLVDTPVENSDQQQLFADSAAVFEALSALRPLLLILDDLHWSDLSSLSLLSHLALRLQASPILLVGAYRPEDITGQSGSDPHPLQPILSDLKRTFGEIVLSLEQPNAAEARRFTDALLDSEPNRLDDSFRQGFAQHTNGHPLFAIELLRDLQARGELYQDEQGVWVATPALRLEEVPPKVEGIIEKRINRLDAEWQKLLTTASVEGETFTAEVIAQIYNIDLRRLIRLLSGPLRTEHRLVQEEGFQQVDGRRLTHYSFQHNLFQQYLYDRLGDIERAFQHEDVGTTLEFFYANSLSDFSPKLAWHFLQAGDSLKAGAYFLQAGDLATNVFAHDEALAHYRQGLELLEKTQTNTELIRELYLRVGQTLEMKGELTAAKYTYEALQELAQSLAEPPLEFAALMALIPLYAVPTELYDEALGIRLSEEALHLMREAQIDDLEAEAKLLWNLLLAYAYTSEIAKAVAYGKQAVAVARQLGSKEQLALVLTDMGIHGYWSVAQVREAQTVLREANSIYRQLDDPAALAHNLSAFGNIQMNAGLLDEAASYFHEAFEISRDITQNSWGKAYSKGTLGIVLREQGKIDAAVEAFETTIQFANQAGFLAYQLSASGFLATLYGELGQIQKGLELISDVRPLVQSDDDFLLTLIMADKARLHLLQGDLGAAEKAFLEGRPHKASMTSPMYSAVSRLVEIELCLKKKQYDQALVKADGLITAMRQSGQRLFLADAYLLKGRIQFTFNQTNEAFSAFISGKEVAESIGSQRMLWQMLFALAEVEPDVELAHRYRSQGETIVSAIAEQIRNPTRHVSFLAQSSA